MTKKSTTTDKTFSYCEHVTAMGPWHIREVGPEGIKLGGGAGPALCFAPRGWTWMNGWDIDVPLEETKYSAERNQEINEQRLGQACTKCVELYRELKR